MRWCRARRHAAARGRARVARHCQPNQKGMGRGWIGRVGGFWSARTRFLKAEETRSVLLPFGPRAGWSDLFRLGLIWSTSQSAKSFKPQRKRLKGAVRKIRAIHQLGDRIWAADSSVMRHGKQLANQSGGRDAPTSSERLHHWSCSHRSAMQPVSENHHSARSSPRHTWRSHLRA